MKLDQLTWKTWFLSTLKYKLAANCQHYFSNFLFVRLFFFLLSHSKIKISNATVIVHYIKFQWEHVFVRKLN